MIGLKIRLWAVSLVAGAALGRAAGFPSVVFTETPRYDGACADRFPAGAALQLVSEGQKRPLVPGFAASADAVVSFDGRRILFSGKQRAADPWQIWEVPLPGGVPRRITEFREDAITPFYVSPDRIVCAHRTPAGFQLEIVSLGEKYTERITHAPGDHLVTDVLRDGRVLFEAPLPGSPVAREIYSVYVDGSGVESYRCDHGRDRHSGVETSSGDIVFETGGRLARFTSARAVQIDLPAMNGEFSGRVAEVSPGDWLAAFRLDRQQSFGIFRWRPGQGLPEKVWGTNGLQAVQPLLVKPHDIPKRHPSGLGDRDGANLLCLSAYASRSKIPRDAVASVRVWALDDDSTPVLLGQTPVETDGSFFVQTPSERAIRFELLDQTNKVVAAEKGWFWARRGEQRVCVGCHAGPERAPENRVPATLLRSTDPARMLLPALPGRKGVK